MSTVTTIDPLSATSTLVSSELEAYGDHSEEIPLYNERPPSPTNFSLEWKHIIALPIQSLLSTPPSARTILNPLLPGILQSRHPAGQRALGPKTSSARSASALDGVRGIAALFVFFFHAINNYTDFIRFGYGAGGNEWFICLPIIRIWFCGPAMVDLFWLVSGYVLALKPLRLAQSNSNHPALLASLSSSTFRRVFRLVLPAAATTLAEVITLRLGWWEPARRVSEDPLVITGHIEPFPACEDTFAAQLAEWWGTVTRLARLWDWEVYFPALGGHLWTIPMEVNSGLITFLVLLGVSRLCTWPRFLTLAFLVVYTARIAHWPIFTFLLGVLVASLDVEILPLLPSLTSHLPAIPSSPLYLLAFAGSLYLLSAPWEAQADAWGYRTLTTYLPEPLWHPCGAALVTLTVVRCPALQRAFNARFPRYLGGISYAFYLLHHPLLHMVGYLVVPRARAWLSPGEWVEAGEEGQGGYRGIDLERESAWKFVLGMAAGVVVTLPLCLWAAEVFSRVVDERCVRFTRWLEEKCVRREGEEERGPGCGREAAMATMAGDICTGPR